ncbi:MAG: hypothetical protein ACI4P7_06280, partial [Bacilli bacterium]
APFKLNVNTEQDGEPTPDTPIEIVTVGSNVNELPYPYPDTTKTVNGITFTDVGDGTVIANGTATGTVYFNLSRPTLKAGNYVFSGIPSGASTSRYFIKFGTVNYVNSETQLNVSQDFTPTESYIRISSGVTVNNLVFKPKLEKGSKATPYSPYGQGSVGIEVVNKNYLNFLDKSGNASGLDYSCNKNIINLNGTPSTNYNIRNIIETIKLKAGTYTFSANIGKFSISNSCQFHFRDKYNNAIVTLNLWGTGNKKTVTFEDDIEIDGKMSYFYTNKNVVFSQDKFVLQIEQGTVATEPVEHEGYTKVLPIQKEFVKIGDYEDTFIKKDGKWYEAHYQTKIVFDGTENFILHTGLTNDNYLVVYKYITGMKSAPKNNLLSNYFVAENARGSKNCIYGGYEQEFDISIAKTIASTVDELKSKLAEWNNNGVPMELYYPLATPELIECTAEQEEIINGGIQLYEDITNITIDNNLAILNVKATIKKEAIEINALTSKKFEVGDTYEITRVCYDNGITKFQAGGNVISVEELPTEEIYSNSYYYLTKDMKYYKYKEETQEWEIDPTIKNTLYIRQDNMFITTQEEIDNIYNLLKGFKIQNINCENRSDLSLDCWDMIKYTTDKGEYYTLNDNEITFSGVSMGKVITNIPTGTKAETTNIIEGTNEQKIRKVQTQINEVEGTLKIVAEETTQIKGQTDENTTNINNNYNEILQKLEGYATEDDIITVNNKVETIQSSTDFAINVIEDIQVNGVSKVKTTTGYTFDENGLEVSKTGAETKSVLNEKGLNVKDNTGSSEESLLFAGYDEKIGETIVKSKNMTVQKYLVIGKYSRVEDYHEGTGVFWIGGN